ncbi:MAG: hypothetical protein KGO81_04850 [Bacteroidota bacterium]|nr:hypothetical protein [Bacteroidota bacterium]
MAFFTPCLALKNATGVNAITAGTLQFYSSTDLALQYSQLISYNFSSAFLFILSC